MALGDLDGLADLRSPPTRWCPSTAPCRSPRCRSSPTPSPRSVVSGSARWQYTTSTKSSPNRSSEPSIACSRYLRLSVFFMLTPSWMPQNSFVVTTYDHRRPAEPAQRLAHDLLAASSGVGLGVVEEVAPGVVGRLHALDGRVDGDLVVEGHPRPERQHRHLDPGTAESPVFHVRLFTHGRPVYRDGAAPVRRQSNVGSSARSHGDARRRQHVLASAIVCRP